MKCRNYGKLFERVYIMFISEMFEQKLKEFITDNKNTVLSKLKATNEEYRQLIEKRNQDSANILALSCNPTLNELIQDYITCAYNIQDIENDTLYLQGIKDCINMLIYIN